MDGMNRTVLHALVMIAKVATSAREARVCEAWRGQR